MPLSNPILERIFSGEVPVAGRLSAAKGLLPLSREELLEAVVHLRQDPDDDVRMAAQDTLFEFKADELGRMGEREHFHADTFSFIWRGLKNREDLFEKVLLNSEIPARVVMQVAAEGGERLSEVIIINQQRLINYPEIIEALLKNQKTSRNTVRVLYELREQFLKERTDLDPLFRLRLGVEALISQSTGAAVASVPAAKIPAPQTGAGEDTEDVETLDETDEVGDEGDEGEGEGETEAEGDESLVDETTEQFANAYAKILTLNIPEKVQCALMGNREERAILIRDSAKLVSEGVLASPKLTPDEIRSFVRLKSLSTNLVSIIAKNKDWMKDDVVMMGIVKHPKTPLAVVTSLLVRISEKQIQKLGKDKEVSEVVRRTVRRYRDAKEQARKNAAKVGKH